MCCKAVVPHALTNVHPALFIAQFSPITFGGYLIAGVQSDSLDVCAEPSAVLTELQTTLLNIQRFNKDAEKVQRFVSGRSGLRYICRTIAANLDRQLGLVQHDFLQDRYSRQAFNPRQNFCGPDHQERWLRQIGTLNLQIRDVQAKWKEPDLQRLDGNLAPRGPLQAQ